MNIFDEIKSFIAAKQIALLEMNDGNTYKVMPLGIDGESLTCDILLVYKLGHTSQPNASFNINNIKHFGREKTIG